MFNLFERLSGQLRQERIKCPYCDVTYKRFDLRKQKAHLAEQHPEKLKHARKKAGGSTMTVVSRL